MKTNTPVGGRSLLGSSRRGLLLLCLSTAAVAAIRNRSVSGVVTDQHGKPLLRAAVQLKDVTTLRVRSFLTGSKGHYRFSRLSPDHSYELQVLYDAYRSDVKGVSVFDENREIVIDFRIEVVLPPAQV